MLKNIYILQIHSHVFSTVVLNFISDLISVAEITKQQKTIHKIKNY
jgi:hypothetical protein